MTTWAQVADGNVINVVTAEPARCFTAEWLENNPPFLIVPDGTQHGATSNGDGTFTNPPAQEGQAPFWNALDFKRRFTTAEQVAIYTAAKTAVLVQVFIALLDTAAACGVMIHADDPDVIAGINAYEAAGLIASGRAAQILSA